MTTIDRAPPEIAPTDLDPDAVKVIARLRQHGFESYFVGGCVRDLLLHRHPKDFDIATSAHPNEIRAIFRNCRLIGRRFRLAHVYFRGGKVVEVSTFRAHPMDIEDLSETEIELNGETEEVEAETKNSDVFITQDNVFGTAEQDARRRDFTINGLFYEVDQGRVIDYVNGRRDLEQNLIRTIGNAELRMREDPIRILRAVRFASKLGFDIESQTYAAMEGAVEDLPRCAPPRLLEETLRLVRSGTATQCLRLLGALDALKLLLPPIAHYFASYGKEGEERFYAHTRALDQMIGSGRKLDDASILTSILLPLADAARAGAEADLSARGISQAIDELLTGLVQNARLPRRIAERIRLIHLAQRTLSGEKRRRGSLMAFRRHPLFAESLAVFEIAVEATGRNREALEKWKSGEAPEALSPPPKPAAKRRRRRGGRRNRGTTPSGGSSASTE